MRVIPYDLERFHNLIDGGIRNTMIWAPRGTGKTYALLMKFLQTDNSVMVIANSGMRRHVQQMCCDLGAPNRRDDIYEPHSIQQYRGRSVDAVFVDEIDYIREHRMDEAMRYIYPELSERPTPGRIIAMSTPKGPRNDDFYERYFQHEFTISNEFIIDWRKPKVKDHFEKEEELFEI